MEEISKLKGHLWAIVALHEVEWVDLLLKVAEDEAFHQFEFVLFYKVVQVEVVVTSVQGIVISNDFHTTEVLEVNFLL